MNRARQDKPKSIPVPRKLAEMVTLGASALLILSVTVYLTYLGLRADDPAVPVEVRLLTDQVQQTGGQFVVPVEVRNRGQRTLRSVKVLVAHRPLNDGGGGDVTDFEIDYLGPSSTQKVYLHLDRHPHSLKLDLRPVHYALD